MGSSAIIGTLRAILSLDTADFESAAGRVSDSAKGFSRDFKAIGQQASSLGSSLTKTLTLPILGIGVGAARLAIDFESAFAGVRKTVDATEPEFQAMSQAFRDLAKEIPISASELAKLGESAGALGIPKAEVVEFSRVMALLGVTTNLTSEQAADSIARIQNIFGAAGQDTDRLASTIVALGNAGASTETEIVEMAQRIAGAGHQIGLTQDQVVAFASTLASVGINAEAGGSSISKVFLKMNDAVMSGGSGLAEFARVAGVSSGAFKDAFEKNAANATVMFIDGLGRLKDAGENTNQTMEGMIGKNILTKDTLNRLTGAGALLSDQLGIGSRAWSENTALTIEAEKRFETTEAQLTLLWNKFKDVGITLGTAMLPAIKTLVGLMSDLAPVLESVAQFFAGLPAPIQLAGIGLLGVVAAAGPLLYVFGQMALAASSVAAAFTTNGIAMKVLQPILSTLFGAVEGGTGILGFFGTALEILSGPIGLLLGAGAGLLTMTGTWDEFFRSIKAVGEIILNVAVIAFEKFVLWGGQLIDFSFGIAKSLSNWIGLTGVLESMGKMLGWAGDQFGKFMGLVADTLEGVSQATSKNLPAVTEPFKKLIGEGLQPADEASKYLSMSMADLAKATIPAGKAADDAAKANKGLGQSQQETEKHTKAQAKAMKDAEDRARALAKAEDDADASAHRLGLTTEHEVNETLFQLTMDLNAATAGGASMTAALPPMIEKLIDLAAKMRTSGMDTSFVTDRIKELEAELAILRGVPPVLPESLFMSGEEGMRRLREGAESVTLGLAPPRTEADKLRGAYETLGLKSRDELLSIARTAREAYDEVSRQGWSSSGQQKQALDEVLGKERAAGIETVSIWEDTIKPKIGLAIDGISTSITDGLIGMIGHWNEHGEKLKEIWAGFKQTFSNILGEMLDDFINKFLKGMLDSIGASKLGEKLGGALLGWMGMGSKAGAVPGIIGGAPLIPFGAGGGVATVPAVGGGIGLGTAIGIGGAVVGAAAVGAGLGYAGYQFFQTAFGPHYDDAATTQEHVHQQFVDDAAYLGMTPEEYSNYSGQPIPPHGEGFRVGTPNLDFVRFLTGGQSVQVHGDEAIIPRGGGHQLAAEIAASMPPVDFGALDFGAGRLSQLEGLSAMSLGASVSSSEKLSGGDQPMNVQVVLDGRVLAATTIRYIPGALQRVRLA